MHYLTGHETTVRRIHHRLGFVWNRTTPGWGNPIESCFHSIWLIVRNSCCARGEGALTECVAGEGKERGGGGSAVQKASINEHILLGRPWSPS